MLGLVFKVVMTLLIAGFALAFAGVATVEHTRVNKILFAAVTLIFGCAGLMMAAALLIVVWTAP